MTSLASTNYYNNDLQGTKTISDTSPHRLKRKNTLSKNSNARKSMLQFEKTVKRNMQRQKNMERENYEYGMICF